MSTYTMINKLLLTLWVIVPILHAVFITGDPYALIGWAIAGLGAGATLAVIWHQV